MNTVYEHFYSVFLKELNNIKWIFVGNTDGLIFLCVPVLTLTKQSMCKRVNEDKSSSIHGVTKVQMLLFIFNAAVGGGGYTVPKVIDFQRYNMKCSGENVILRGIIQVVSGLSLHFMFYRWNLDCFSNRVLPSISMLQCDVSHACAVHSFTVAVKPVLPHTSAHFLKCG